MSTTASAFLKLIQIIDELREQCPWDKKQTIQTLRSLTIEETYELAEAIEESNWEGIKEELGDLLLHIIFYARIGKEEAQFTINEIMNGICEKLIARHPHIYGDVKVQNAEEVKKNWEKLKLKEGKNSVLSGVPKSLPATVKAMRLQEKAKQIGFEWQTKEQVWEKVDEEIRELKEAIAGGEQAQVEGEFGDVLFSLINYARFLNLDAEIALERTNKKFMNRVFQMEQHALSAGQRLEDLTLEEMDDIWNTIKRSNKT